MDNADTLAEIFSRLPTTDISCVRRVCKHWNNISTQRYQHGRDNNRHLEFACRRGLVASVRFLLQQEDVVTGTMYKCLFVALNSISVLELLLSLDLSTYDLGIVAFDAIEYQMVKGVSYLLKHPNICSDLDDLTLLLRHSCKHNLGTDILVSHPLFGKLDSSVVSDCLQIADKNKCPDSIYALFKTDTQKYSAYAYRICQLCLHLFNLSLFKHTYTYADLSANNNWALRFAVSECDHNFVALILSDPRVDPNANGHEALMTAIFLNDEQTFGMLMADSRIDPFASIASTQPAFESEIELYNSPIQIARHLERQNMLELLEAHPDFHPEDWPMAVEI